MAVMTCFSLHMVRWSLQQVAWCILKNLRDHQSPEIEAFRDGKNDLQFSQTQEQYSSLQGYDSIDHNASSSEFHFILFGFE